MNHYLKDIIEYKREIVERKKVFYCSLKERFDKNPYTRYGLFKKRISQLNKISLIAEIKKASPSKGLIRENFDFLSIANIYCQHQADAISVLTEDKYFLGKPSYIKEISGAFNVPVLAKDFFIHEGQIYEARLNGASAVLLIVAILEDSLLRDMIELSKNLDIDCLVEIHNEEELKRALDCGAEIIGINNRNLNTFEVDIRICEQLAGKVPSEKIIVAESGINTNEEIKNLKKLGIDAVLIGEAFMKSENISLKIQEMMLGVND